MIEEFSTFVSMNKRNHIRAFFSIVLVFFLFTPVLVRTLNACTEGTFKRIGFTKTSGAPVKSDSQFLVEEKEKEDKGAHQSLTQPPIIYVIAEFSLFTPKNSRHYSYIPDSGFFQGTPRYLAKRSILI
jgi:hypothetical protein